MYAAYKAFPLGGKVAPQGRMRGEFSVVSRLWVIMANLPLISQRAGPLTASPKGEAFFYSAKNAFCTALRTAARPAVKLTPPCR